MKMLNLTDRDLRDLETLKSAVRKQLRKQKIGKRAEISENLLKEVFFEVKDTIKQKTKYRVDKFDFPKGYLFAWVFWKRDYNKLLRFVFNSMSKKRKKTEQAWKEEYSQERSFSRAKRVRNFSIALEKNKGGEEVFFFIVLSTMNRDSLKHEMTQYFELILELGSGSLTHIWNVASQNLPLFV